MAVANSVTVATAVSGVSVVDENVTVDLISPVDKQASPLLLLLAVTVKSGLVLELTSAWFRLNCLRRRTTCVPARIFMIHDWDLVVFVVG